MKYSGRIYKKLDAALDAEYFTGLHLCSNASSDVFGKQAKVDGTVRIRRSHVAVLFQKVVSGGRSPELPTCSSSC